MIDAHHAFDLGLKQLLFTLSHTTLSVNIKAVMFLRERDEGSIGTL